MDLRANSRSDKTDILSLLLSLKLFKTNSCYFGIRFVEQLMQLEREKQVQENNNN